MGWAELAFWVDEVQELASMERLKEIQVPPILGNQVSSDKDPLSPAVYSQTVLIWAPVASPLWSLHRYLWQNVVVQGSETNCPQGNHLTMAVRQEVGEYQVKDCKELRSKKNWKTPLATRLAKKLRSGQFRWRLVSSLFILVYLCQQICKTAGKDQHLRSIGWIPTRLQSSV